MGFVPSAAAQLEKRFLWNLRNLDIAFNLRKNRIELTSHEKDSEEKGEDGFYIHWPHSVFYYMKENKWGKQIKMPRRLGEGSRLPPRKEKPITRRQAEKWLGLPTYTLRIVEIMQNNVYEVARRISYRRWSSDKIVEDIPRTKGFAGCVHGIPKIKKGSFAKVSRVYFLVKNNKVIYVGKTNEIWPKRVIEHVKGSMSTIKKDFDAFYYIDVPHFELALVEKNYINHFKPKYNIASKI